DIGPARQAPMKSNPTGVPPHYFDHHHSLVTGCGRVQPIKRIHDRGNGRIETERHCRGFKVVVDGLGNADAINSSLLKLKRGGHRTIASYYNERAYSQFLQDASGLFD